MEKMTIHCLYFNVSVLSDPELFARGLELLPWEARREKVMRFRTERDRQRCLGAGLLAAWMLKSAGAGDLSLTYGEQGKPALTAHTDIHFNLSHSGSFAVCAVADHPVGVDVEQVREAHLGIAKRFFLPGEFAWISQSADPDRAFYRLWTRKESALKRLGEGLSRPLDSLCVLPGKESEENAAFSEWDADGHMICVCAEKNDKVQFERWSLPQCI